MFAYSEEEKWKEKEINAKNSFSIQNLSAEFIFCKYTAKFYWKFYVIQKMHHPVIPLSVEASIAKVKNAQNLNRLIYENYTVWKDISALSCWFLVGHKSEAYTLISNINIKMLIFAIVLIRWEWECLFSLNPENERFFKYYKENGYCYSYSVWWLLKIAYILVAKIVCSSRFRCCGTPKWPFFRYLLWHLYTSERI